MSRQFTAIRARRERVPMLVGLIGPSGSGKTFSALRMATGMARITGGRVKVIDTEARRSLHYADDFDFDHIEMEPPFSPLDYLEAIRFASAHRDDVLIVDSMSHEHDGQGGVLEMHAAEVERMAGSDVRKQERVKFAAWIRPKADRRKLINAVLQMGVNGIFCFRAKEKTKPVSGQDPIHMGWQPIAGEEFIFEMLVNVLLYPGAGGIPNWAPDESAENAMLKLPGALRHCFAHEQPISEDTGEQIARWAMGPDKGHQSDLDGLIYALETASDLETLSALRPQVAAARWSREERGLLIAAGTARRIWLEQEDEPSPEPSEPQAESPGSGDPAASGDAVEVDPETGEPIPADAGKVF